MAKSGRSKIKRANRALKREKTSKKEFAKLEKMVAQAKETIAGQTEKKVYTVLGAATTEPETKQEELMMVDGAEPVVTPIATSTTPPQTTGVTEIDDDEELPMGVGPRLANGSFPVWMNKRAVKRAKKVERKKSRQKSKGKQAKGRPWRT